MKKNKVIIKKRVSLSEDDVISMWRAANDRKSLPDYGGDKDAEEIFLHMFNSAMYKTDSAWQIVDEEDDEKRMSLSGLHAFLCASLGAAIVSLLFLMVLK